MRTLFDAHSITVRKERYQLCCDSFFLSYSLYMFYGNPNEKHNRNIVSAIRYGQDQELVSDAVLYRSGWKTV